jgi:septum formation protein|eukprot:m.98908 g.98908  ORF g.98908 m.98908 type:complete len:218 (-) comp27111_c0_seq1:340-993(-)
MLSSIKPQLAGCRIVLASGSPRRKELLAKLLPTTENNVDKFEVIPSTFAEDIDKTTVKSAAEYVERTAACKGREVRDFLLTEGDVNFEGKRTIIISADTVVVAPDGQILEKPADAAAATAMLSKLSGKSHSVITGLVLFEGETRESACHEVTTVQFAELAPSDIAEYVASGEPFDKAGGYGIQGVAGAFVTGINGCFFNVMGFPQHRFCQQLCDFLE